ncbi:MAG: ribosome silencing factor [Chitinivibrionales bacterium]|nr:ribosome silencing factor [Chitinivibrionales bacterium]
MLPFISDLTFMKGIPDTRTTTTLEELAGESLVEQIIRAAFEKKAEQITAIDLRGKSAPAQWYLVCQGSNAVQTRAISNEIITSLKKQATSPSLVEGLDEGIWVLIDFVDVIAHVMIPQARSYYNLEQLWDDVSIRQIESAED